MNEQKLYNSHNLAIAIKKQAKLRDVSLKTMLEELQLGSNTMSALYHDKSIAFDSLARIADYLDCSVDYLLGRTEVTQMTIGTMIRQLRGDMSLREFAEKCNVSHTTIDTLEKGYDFRTKKPAQAKVTTLQKIADACNVSLSYITGELPVITCENELKAALFGSDIEVTDEMWNEIKTFSYFLKIKYNKLNRTKHMEFASRLRLSMKKEGISSEQLRKMTKIPSFTIAKYILGEEIPKPNGNQLNLLANALKVSEEWLNGKIDIDTSDEESLKKVLFPDTTSFNNSKWEQSLNYIKIINQEIQAPRENPEVIEVYEAASSVDNHPPKSTALPSERWSTFENTPETDDELK